MSRVALIEGIRTPFVKAGAEFRDVPAYELGRTVVTELIDRVDHPELEIDALMMGNIIGPPEASNIARVISLKSGLPVTTPAYSLNMNCASGMLSLAQAYDLIASGQAKAVIAGGTESMSSAPLHFPKAMSNFLEAWMRSKTVGQKLKTLTRFRLGFLKPVITLTQGLTDPISGMIMGDTAEVLAKRYGISREEQDRFALRSHQNYFKAVKSGFYSDHLIPVFAGKSMVNKDIGPRDNLTMEQLAKLKPFFDRQFGTVTVGNSCPITDGAAVCLLMEEEYARNLGLKPKFFIRAHGFQGLPPEIMGLGPVVATAIALKRAQVTMADIGLIEINEAFAVQVLAVMRLFDSPKLYQDLTGESQSPLRAIDIDKLNVNGGAIALGHPVGTSGTRITINLYKEMQRRQIPIGLAAICVGGGLGGAMILEQGA